MEVKELQQISNDFLNLLHEKYNCDHNSNNTVLHLSEEVGEIAREINKSNIRKNESLDINNLKEQIGDVMILIMRLAQIHDVDIETTIQMKIKKIKKAYRI